MSESKPIMIVGYFSPTLIGTVPMTPILANKEDKDFWFTPEDRNTNIKRKVQEILTTPLVELPLGVLMPVILRTPVLWKGGEKLVRVNEKVDRNNKYQFVVDFGKNFTVFQFDKEKVFTSEQTFVAG